MSNIMTINNRGLSNIMSRAKKAFGAVSKSLDAATIDAVLNNIDKYEGSTIVLKFGGEMIADSKRHFDAWRRYAD
jgi:hypothetical protein